MKKSLFKRIIASVLTMAMMVSMSGVVFADEGKGEVDGLPESNGNFSFTSNPNQRIDSDGSFAFNGDQIVSDVFTISGTSTTITANAVAERGDKFSIELFQRNAGDTGWRSVKKNTYIADGENHSFTYTTISERKLYFVIKSAFISTRTLDGTGTVTNYEQGFGKPW